MSMDHRLQAPTSLGDAPEERAASTLESRIVQAAFEAIVTIDAAQRILMFNPAAQRMFGWTYDQVSRQPLSMLLPERYRATHDAHVRRFMETGQMEIPVDGRGAIWGLRSDGKEFPLGASISRSPVGVAQEVGPVFTALLRDLSEEHRLEASVEALQLQMRSIFELAPVAIWITRLDRITFANRASAALFGAQNRKMLGGRSIYSLLMPESHHSVRSAIALAAEQGVVPLLNERVARLDGSARDVVIAVAGLPEHGDSAVQMVITDVTEQASVTRQLEQSRRDLRRLSASQVAAREEERRRIALELHDELGQRLLALKIELSGIGHKGAPGGLDAQLPALLDMVDETVGAVRRIVTELRPPMLDDLGLRAAVEWLARDWSRRTTIPVELDLEDNERPLGEETSVAVFRICQEALTNIARHAQATRARIELRRTAKELVLIVSDDGIGFSAETAFGTECSNGLLGIRERANMLGGTLTIGGVHGGMLTVWLPLPGVKPRRTET